MTLLLEPTRQLPPAGNGQGGLRPLAAGFGRWQEAIFAGFGILVKKRAFFNESSARPPLEVPKSATKLPNFATMLSNGVTELPNFVEKLPNIATKLLNIATELPNSVKKLPNIATKLPNIATMLSNYLTQLPNSVKKLLNFLTELTNSEADLTNLMTTLTVLEAEVCDKMAQIVALQADLTTAKTPRTPRVNFVKKLGEAGVTRLKLKEVRDFLHRLLHSLINLNAPNLKTGIQGVGYASNNDSAAWRLLLPGG